MYANKPEMAKEWSAKESEEETFNGAVNNVLERMDETQLKVTVYMLAAAEQRGCLIWKAKAERRVNGQATLMAKLIQ